MLAAFLGGSAPRQVLGSAATIGETHQVEHQRGTRELLESAVLPDRASQSRQLDSRLLDVCVDLSIRERPQADRGVERELRRQLLVLLQAAAHDHARQSDLPREPVDRFHASRPVLGRDLVQAVEEQEQSVMLQPFLADLPGDLILVAQLVHQPGVQG